MIINKLKEERAISLIAIIPVIIILLILAGIVSQTTNTSKILETAETSAAAYIEESKKENVEMKLTNLNIEKLNTTKKPADLQDVLELKNNDPEVTDSYRYGDNVVLVIDDYQYEIDDNLQIKSIYTYDGKNEIKQVKRVLTFCTFDRAEDVD